MNCNEAPITVSIVSHGHGPMVEGLVAELKNCPEVRRILLTRNIPETFAISVAAAVEFIDNANPRGFGANHNEAFNLCDGPFFCILNPDIELRGNPFPALLQCLRETGAGLVAPLVLSPNGKVEDSARRFPTVLSLLRKVMGGHDGRYHVDRTSGLIFPDWTAGMFMLFSADDFRRMGGFDERYFLYYEDVDICDRLWHSGRKIALCPSVSVFHDARRDSHRSLRHLRWHLQSAMRYLTHRR